MIALFVQALITLLTSAVLLFMLQPVIYFVIGIAAAVLCCGLMLDVRLREEALTPATFIYTLGLTIVIGLFWPVIPCAATYAVLAERRADGDRPARSREH